EGMGNLVRRVKERPKRGTLIYFVVGILVVIALFLVVRYYQMRREDDAKQWLLMQDSSQPSVLELIKETPDSPAGKAALLEHSWLTFWEEGMKMLGHDPRLALKKIGEAYEGYAMAAKYSEGDPTFEPEALFGIAICEETRAVNDRGKLKAAKEAYEKLANH